MEAGEEYCHAFMGVCGNLSANELFACTTELDALLKQGKTPEPEQFERLRHLLQEVVNEIDGLAAPAAGLPVVTTALGHDALLAGLETLAALLENDVGAAEGLIAELRSGVAGTEAEPAVLEIAASVDAFAIDEALAQINVLRKKPSGTV